MGKNTTWLRSIESNTAMTRHSPNLQVLDSTVEAPIQRFLHHLHISLDSNNNVLAKHKHIHKCTLQVLTNPLDCIQLFSPRKNLLPKLTVWAQLAVCTPSCAPIAYCRIVANDLSTSLLLASSKSNNMNSFSASNNKTSGVQTGSAFFRLNFGHHLFNIPSASQ